MPAGTPTPRLRRDGRWEIRVSLGGKRISVYGRDVLECLDRYRALLPLRTRNSAPQRITVREAVPHFLAAYAATWKPRTLADHRTHVERFVVPAIGDKLVHRVGPHDILTLLTTVRGSRQKQKVWRTLSRFFAFCQAVYGLPTNPLHGLPAPRHRSVRPTLPSISDLQRLFAVALDDHTGSAGTYVGLALLTGMRPGELAALRWSDIDGDRRMVFVRRTVAYVNGHFVETAGKTTSSERAIPLSDEALVLLARQRRHVDTLRQRAGAQWQDADLVFPGHHGQPVHRSVIHKWVRRICHAAGVPPLRPHDLRHAAASVLVDAGVPLPAVAQLLGHTTPTTTSRVYAHALRLVPLDVLAVALRGHRKELEHAPAATVFRGPFLAPPLRVPAANAQ